MSKASVTSIDELIAKLNGPAGTARVLNSRPQTVCNWRSRGRIPARLFVEHERALSVLGISAPLHLWGFSPPRTIHAPTEEQAA